MVGRESREMRSRLLDIKGFLLNIIAEPSQDLEPVQQLLDNRYAMQYDSIEIITSQYLGPAEDTARLLAAMQELESTQNETLLHILPMSKKETA